MTSSEGSWWPLLLIVTLTTLRIVICSPSAVDLRRWFQLRKVKLRKQLGYRDDSKYASGGAGQGASANVKRQG
ncbi:hypothetical protein FisN_23Lh014 [Fistulifera solaris]|uniref:Uncharacterized protein n=1 Tax=Fistulifera solaris TaxID=1519565 RepID=A0A1Z5KJN0_FISSO|nr:hypothetical protein FisN_23Lh014 [Fistulifera solaris]|eukprot:GAX26489.1 hypothetical protein FisN_23Lh014 [Fistulifera solaris]